MTGFPDTMYGNATTHTRMQSETADGVTWARYVPPPLESPKEAPTAAANDRALADALSRVTFEELASPTPLQAALRRAGTLERAIVVVGRSRRLAVGGPPCGAAHAGGGPWRGSRGRAEDGGGRRDGVCDGWHQCQSAGDAGV
jgi:hypothetical protein